MVDVYFTLELGIISQRNPVWICLFGQDLLGDSTYITQQVNKTGKSQKLRLPVVQQPILPSIDNPIHCFIYTQRQSPAGLPFITRCGFCSCTLLDAEEDRAQPVLNMLGQKIGSFKVQIPPESAGQIEFALEEDTKNEDPAWLLLAMHRKLMQQQQPLQLSRTNIPKELPPMTFSTVPQHCGDIPIWAFTALNLRTDDGPSKEYFEQALYNAKYLLMVDRIDFSDKKLVAEVLNEIHTLPVRGLLYVMDMAQGNLDRDEPVDEWINPLLCPVQKLAGFDCEDATQRMIQEGVWLRRMMQGNSELARLAEVDRKHYITFLSAMTLKLPGGGWTYHAAGLKLDRRFVLQRLGFADETKEDEYWPAVMLEGTAYTTGCWQYTSVLGQQLADKIAASGIELEFTRGKEAICKATPTQMNRKNLYGPIQSLFSVQLAEEFDILQIDLSENGKRAAASQSVMSYNKANVKWSAVMMDGWKPRVEAVKRAYFPPAPIPKAAVKPQRPAITKRKTASIDLCFRAVDWDSEVRSELEKQVKRPVRAVQLDLAADLNLVHVTDG